MKIDIWYPKENVAAVSVAFYPNDCEYRGNLYNKKGRIIGDFTSKNSLEIEKRFPGIFGK